MSTMSAAQPIGSPYQLALTLIRQHVASSGALALNQLVLSLWNEECSYSFREWIRPLDDRWTSLALQKRRRTTDGENK